MNFSPYPYPGLRPFETDESDIFFGREKQTDELLTKLQRHRFLAVVGPSGCGKSSLVRAGMIASMKVGFMVTAGSRWHVANMRPGNDPFARLAGALAELAPIDRIKTERPDLLPFLEASLRHGPLSLVEAAAETGLCQGANLLLLVDQFEELFRFRRTGNENESDAFVKLLLASAAQQDLAIYLVITMRSDYLGDCSLFPGLPEAINESQYLTPRLTRDQCSEAITGPARVFGGDVDDALVHRLLNDFGPDPDRLPVLQHALMRMWHRAHASPVRPRQVVLRLEDYEAIGGLDDALSSHADEVLAGLSDEQQRIAQVMFRRLTERGLGGQDRDTRAPTSLREIAEIARADDEAVKAVAEVFRKSDRSFITPREAEPLDADATLDIGHESLIKQWKTLDSWAEAEAESARTYKRLRDTAILWKNKKAALWGTPDLEWALEWEQRESPTEVWARRYANKPDSADLLAEFSLALSFLRASQRNQEHLHEQARKAERRKLLRLWWAASSAVMIAITLSVGIFVYWDRTIRIHTGYYSELVRLWGQPRGIGRLTADEAAHVSSSYRVSTEGTNGKVIRIEVVTVGNRLTGLHGMGTYLQYRDELAKVPVAWEYAYDSQGNVTYEFALDHKRERLWGFAYSPPRDKRTRTGHYVGPDGYPIRKEPYAGKFIEIQYDGKGRETRIRYLTIGGRPVRGLDNAFGVAKKYDDEGFVTEMTSLDPDGKPMNDEVGNATLRIAKRDRFGNPLEDYALDVSGQPAVTKEGWSLRRAQVDSEGHVLSQAFFESAGAPALHTNGYHEVRFEYDKNGYTTKETYWNIKGEPTVSTAGCYGLRREFTNNALVTREDCLGPQEVPMRNKRGFSTRLLTLDDQERPTEETLLNEKDELTLAAEGYARATVKYGSTGDAVERSYFGVDGRLILANEGYAQQKDEFDARGNLVSTAFIGPDNRLISAKDGYASVTWEYDDHSLVTRVRYFGADGKRAISTSGYAGWIARYDGDARKIESWNIGPDDALLLGKEGYAGWRADYDASGNQSRVAYFGLRREPVVSSTGIHGWEAEFDKLGHATKRRYFGLVGESVTHKNGSAGYRAQYDARGNEVSAEYFDIAGNPTVLLEDENDKIGPYARVEKRYTSRNQLLEEAYFGVSGEPILTKAGWARAAHAYDHRGNQVQTAYFHVDGKPTLNALGYHRVSRVYDDWHNLLEVSYVDVNGNPMESNDGYARLVNNFDVFGRLVKQSLFDKDGKPALLRHDGFHQAVTMRDEQGRKVGESYFDTAGKPTTHRNGYHAERYAYDDRGNTVVRWHTDSQDQLVVDHSTNCALIRSAYDERGNEIDWRCFGADNAPRPGRDGYAQARFKFNDRNQSTDVRYLGVDGKPVSREGGYAAYHVEYDLQGRPTGWQYFGPDGNPVLVRKDRSGDSGYASQQTKYDAHGNQIEDSFFGVDNRPAMAGQRFHRITRKFNGRRQLTEEATYGTTGALVMNALRYAKVVHKYDDKGNLIEIAAYDTNGRPSEATYGYAKMTMKYDPFGRIVEEAYWGADDRPKVLADGSRITIRYDDNGNVVEKRSFHGGYTLGHVTATYDSRRQKVQERYFDQRDSLVGITKFAYDERGDLVRQWYLNPRGEPTTGLADSGDLCKSVVFKYQPDGSKVSACDVH